MTLYISEIGVRMAVRDPAGGPEAEHPHPSGQDGGELVLSPRQRDEIVNECVRVVLRTLRMAEAR